MIKIDLVLGASLLLSFSICLVFAWWIIYNCSEDKNNAHNETKYLEQCPYCTYLFMDYNKKELQVCPHCKSYIDTKTQAV